MRSGQRAVYSTDVRCHHCVGLACRAQRRTIDSIHELSIELKFGHMVLSFKLTHSRTELGHCARCFTLRTQGTHCIVRAEYDVPDTLGQVELATSCSIPVRVPVARILSACFVNPDPETLNQPCSSLSCIHRSILASRTKQHELKMTLGQQS